MKKLLLLFLALVLIFSNGIIVLGQASDYENSWAKNEINYMRQKGIIAGYPDGTFKPTNKMSKSEFYKVINGLMGYTEKSESRFIDVNSTDWYYEEVQKGLMAKYILPGERLNARDNITRGEVARIISVVFGIEEDTSAAEVFVDNLKMPRELKGVIGGLKKNGFISGFPDGTFRPQAEITRAEVVKILYNISGEIVNISGTVSKDIKTNLVVNTGDVVLKDMTIEGNLYLTEGIGEGDISLDNVVVKGELSIKGGGANSVIIKNSKINVISIGKQLGLVRVVLENTAVEEIKTINEVKLELINGTKINKVELYGKIEVLAEKGAVISTLNVVSKEVTIESKGDIKSILAKEEIKINGEKVKANIECKVVEGKVLYINKDTNIKPPSSGGSGGGISDDYEKPIPKPEEPIRLTGIKISKAADKLVYEVGEKLDITGLEVIGVYSDGSKKVKEITIDNITGFDSSKAVVSQILIITIDGKTITYTIEIKEKEVEKPVEPANYEFTVKLDKKDYTVDDDITLSGITLKNSIGLNGVDVTLKLVDDEGNLVTLDQIHTGTDGKFTYIFKVPAETVAGSYKLTVKANDPVSKTVELDLVIKEKEKPVEEPSEVIVTFDIKEITAEVGEYFPDKDDIWLLTTGLEDDDIDSIVIKSSDEKIISVTQRPAHETQDPKRKRCYGKAIAPGEAKIIATVTTVDGKVYTAECKIVVGTGGVDEPEKPDENIEITLNYSDGMWIFWDESVAFSINVTTIPNDAKYYRVVLKENLSDIFDRNSDYYAKMNISIGDFEELLKTEKTVIVQFFKEDKTTIVAEIQVVPIPYE